MRRFGSGFLLVVLAVAGLTGCGDDNKVGDKSLLDFKEQAQNRLGETTTTTAAPTTTTAAAAPTGPTRPGGGAGTPKPTSATTATTRPPTATTATTAVRTPQAATLEVVINGDNSGAPAIDPQYARVFVGSIVRWVNRDTVPRSVKADSGQFVSPPIPPGGSYDYKATTAGLFDYADDTRPYVHATLEVLPA